MHEIAPLGPALESAAETRRQQGADLLDARLEELGDAHRLVALRPHLGTQPREARRPALQLGDTDDVLIGHPQGEVARGLGQGIVGDASRADAAQPLEVTLRVGGVLIFDEPAQPLLDKRNRRCGKFRRRGAAHLVEAKLADRQDEPVVARRRGVGRVFGGEAMAGFESGEIGVHGDARLANRRREAVARDRQNAAAGERAKEHGVERELTRRGVMGQIEEDRPSRHLARRAQDARGIEAAIRHLLFLDDGVDPMRRGDQRRAIGGDVADLDCPSGLEQLGGDDDVDVAGTRVEAENRAISGEGGIGRRKDLDIVGGGAGALRDAGDRGALHRQIGRLRGGDQPIGQDAAALAAEGADENGQRARRHVIGRHEMGGHETAGAGASPPRRRNAAIVRWRQAAMKRSNPLAFCTMSAR